MLIRRALFICTGNYYRSRVAEILFNAIAGGAGLDWKADSRGTAVGHGNVGPMSRQAIEWLRTRGIKTDGDLRFPLQLQTDDLAHADLVIALNESEHRPYLEEQFPQWAGRVAYWHIADLGLAPLEEALTAIEREVRQLVRRLC